MVPDIVLYLERQIIVPNIARRRQNYPYLLLSILNPYQMKDINGYL